MRALSLASGGPATCLDWNNNYGEEPDKCILFHCGPVPASLMTGQGQDRRSRDPRGLGGPGCGFGCNAGRMRAGDMTFGNMLSDSGSLKFYLGQGKFCPDPIPEDYFGCAGVAEIRGLESVLQHIGHEGHRHHVSITAGTVVEPVREALAGYLGCAVSQPQAAEVRP